MKNEREILADLVKLHDEESGFVEFCKAVDKAVHDAKRLWHIQENTAIEYMTNREYWLMTCTFVYLHGSDVCGDPGHCKHCEFIEKHWPRKADYQPSDDEEHTNDPI